MKTTQELPDRTSKEATSPGPEYSSALEALCLPGYLLPTPKKLLKRQGNIEHSAHPQ